MISDDMTGLLVLRSLTKTWGLAGLRAGYVIGDPKLIAAMRLQQPPWSVSTPALAAMVACLTPRPAALPPRRPRRSPAGGPTWWSSWPTWASRLLADPRLRSCWSTPAAYAVIGNLAGSASPCATTVSPYAVARPSPASGPTGSGSPYATPKPLTSSVAAFRRLVRL